MDCCIYILYWDIDYPYIGQTNRKLNIRARAHFNALKRGDHCNYKLQDIYRNKGTLPNIEVLQVCYESELDYLEELYISDFDSINNGLNIISGGYSVGRGVNNSSSKYSRESLIQAFELLVNINNSFKDITKITGIPKDTLTKINTGIQHTWLHEEFPELWNTIKNIPSKSRYSSSASAIKQGKQYRDILSPDGIRYSVSNTLEFSNKHNLSNGNLCQVLLGKRRSVSGWLGIDKEDIK